MQGWGKVKAGCEYSGVSDKTFRSWLKEGLKHSRLPSGRILVKYTDIDQFLQRFQVSESAIDKAVDEILNRNS